VIEDVAIALGRAIDKLLGDRTAIARFGWAAVPMDDGIVERILFTTRCRVIASQEADEKIAKFRIRIYDFETVVLMVTSVALLLSVHLPTPMTIVTSIVGIIYSALIAWLKLRRSPLFLQ
jgi:imidazoleglycerol phosphate dehydratase HisB